MSYSSSRLKIVAAWFLEIEFELEVVFLDFLSPYYDIQIKASLAYVIGTFDGEEESQK